MYIKTYRELKVVAYASPKICHSANKERAGHCHSKLSVVIEVRNPSYQNVYVSEVGLKNRRDIIALADTTKDLLYKSRTKDPINCLKPGTCIKYRIEAEKNVLAYHSDKFVCFAKDEMGAAFMTTLRIAEIDLGVVQRELVSSSGIDTCDCEKKVDVVSFKQLEFV
jgi:hypothetical protein